MQRQETVAESIAEVTAMVVTSALTWTLCAWVIKRDEKKLSEIMLERAYAPATLVASVFMFQQLAVIVHFVRTRRSFKGFFLGLGWAVATIVPALIIDAVFGLFLPE